jgi:hypothetical protein
MVRLVTRFELANRSTQELRALYREMVDAATRAPSGSADKRNALASLDTIASELGRRPRL